MGQDKWRWIPKGVTYLYLVNDNTDKIIEVYPFTVK